MGMQDRSEAVADALWFTTQDARRLRFYAIAACTKDGRRSFEQLKMNGMEINGMLERFLWN
jgi:hypothetical protein